MNNDSSSVELPKPEIRETPPNFQNSLNSYDSRITSLYGKELLKLQESKESTEILSWHNIQDVGAEDDMITRMAQLTAKYKEYTQRLANPEGIRILNPDTKGAVSSGAIDSLFKREVVRQLILRGSVDKLALGRALENVVRSPDAYEKAYRVVRGYVRDGGKTLFGGTDLRQPITVKPQP